MTARLPLILAAVICSGVWAGFWGLQHIAGQASFLDRAESVLADFRIHAFGPRAAPRDIAIVAIDDATVTAAGRYPLDRAQLARIVRQIVQAGARGLVVDLLLIDATNETDDQDLATALSSLPSVIAAAAVFQGSHPNPTAVPEPSTVLWPRAAFSDAAKTGLVNISNDAGGTPRHMPLVFNTDQGPVPSIGLQAVGMHSGQSATLATGGVRVQGRLQRLDIGWHVPLRFYGPSATITTYSAQSLLDATATPADLRGRLVLLGATATAIGDRFGTPFDPVMPGVEVLATGIANLVDGSALVRDQGIRWIDAAATLILTAIGVLSIAFLPLAIGSAIYLASFVLWSIAITVAFGQGYWLSGALPLAGSLPPFIVMVLIRQQLDRRKTHRLTIAQSELSRFQAPALARRIAADPEFLLTPVKQDAAILFIDLSGFTGLSERIGPSGTREVLKSFHWLVVEVSERRGGLVLDFMGDGAMIGFGVPDAGPNDASDALQTAFALVNATGVWIEQSELQADIHDVRVGVHCGPVVLSRLGHETHQQIAATGDCVNVASRLMEIAKTHSASIVASSQLLSAATDSGSEIPEPRETTTVAIRGRKKPIPVAMWKAAFIVPSVQGG